MLDVLVVGAGPTGLTMASELARHGLDCRVIDALAEPVTYSKAAAVHARTMEVFDAMGCADAILARAKTIHGANVFAGGKRIAHVSLGELDSPYPCVYGISQRETEAVLAAHAARAGVAIARDTRLDGFTQDDAGVRAHVTRAGTADTIAARWLVGCDGAHSKVREVLGIAFDGAPYEEKLVQADLHVAWAKDMPDDEMLLFLGDGEEIALFPLFGDGRYRMVILDVGTEHDKAPELDSFQRALERVAPGARVYDPAWITAFRIHHRHAAHYRDRRAFIAGDATHIHSPTGGQGMNTGIQDAFNLAWKLALVQRGVAAPAILASYEAERSPVAAALLATTDTMTRSLERAVSIRHPIARAVRDRLMGFVSRLAVVQARASRGLSMLDIGYRDSPIVAQDRKTVLHAKVVGTNDDEAPTLRDWAAFGDGPAPGERAYPLVLPGVSGGDAHPLRDRRHVALLFDGAAATAAGYANLASIAASIASRCGDEVATHVIVPRATRPAALDTFAGSILLDGDGEAHRRYGARSECLYLVRPDGYVAYRSQPADGARVLEYLDTIFTPSPTRR